MRQISKIHFTPKGELSNNFISLKKFEIRTVRPTKKKPAQFSGFTFLYSMPLYFSSYYLLIFFNKSIVPETSSPSFLPKLTANSAYFLDSSFLDNL